MRLERTQLKASMKIISLLLPPFFLTGCLLERDAYVEQDLTPKISIDSRSHLIKYKSGGLSLSNEDKLTLKRLYQEFNPLDPIVVRIGVDHSPAYSRSKKTMDRLNSLKKFLTSLGVNSSQVQVVDKGGMKGSDLATGEPGIIVSFQKTTATPPDRPCWDYRMDGNLPPEGEPGFGMANARNTAIMASDPNVLVNAEEFGGSDGSHSAISIQELRTDKVKKLKVEQIKNATGSN